MPLVHLLSTIALICSVTAAVAQRADEIPSDIIDAQSVVEDLVLDVRYATTHNFVGRVIPGYRAAKCLLTRRAAEALEGVQRELQEFALALKVYDCYRPQSAVDAFVDWADDLDDQTMKAEFYPNVDKQNLFRDGYIAARSGHSRASTVDLTIVPRRAQPAAVYDSAVPPGSCENDQSARFPDASLDMGTGYDCFSVRSHTIFPGLSPQQRAHRLLLERLMKSHGFRGLAEEWWHFTLVDEPYPETYFDFPVE